MVRHFDWLSAGTLTNRVSGTLGNKKKNAIDLGDEL
jgi:hypothetical protein